MNRSVIAIAYIAIAVGMNFVADLATAQAVKAQPVTRRVYTDEPVIKTTPHAAVSDLHLNLPVVLTADRVIKRWDATGKLSSTIGEAGSALNAIAFVPGTEGSILASVDADGLLKLWDVKAGRVIWSVATSHGETSALSLSSDGRLIATGGADGHIRIWQRAHGKLMADQKAHDDSVQSLRFTHDGHGLISGSADRTIRFWRVDGNRANLDYVSTIEAHDGAVTAIDLSPDDKRVASVSTDGFLKIWELPSGALRTRTHVCGRSVDTVVYSPDGRIVATGDSDGKIRLWSADTGLPLPFEGSREGAILSLAWTSGGLLVSGSADKTLSFWNITTDRQVACIAAHEGAVQTLAVLP